MLKFLLLNYPSITSYEADRSSSWDISINDSLTIALGSREHLGRVRGLGLGACWTQVFGNTPRSYSMMSSSNPSNVELKNEVARLRSWTQQMKEAMALQQQQMQASMATLL